DPESLAQDEAPLGRIGVGMTTWPKPNETVPTLSRAGGEISAHSWDHGTLIGAPHNVKHYVGIGHGSGDDTTAFLAAIAAAKTGADLGYAHLYVPPGYYIVNGDAVVDVLYNTGGWLIEGAGTSATTIAAKTGTTCAFGWEGCNNMTVRDIQFNGNGTGASR